MQLKCWDRIRRRRKNEGEWTRKVKIRKQKKSVAAGEAYMAIF